MKPDLILNTIGHFLQPVLDKHIRRSIDGAAISEIRQDILDLIRDRRLRSSQYYEDRPMQLGFDVYVDRQRGTIRVDFDNPEDVARLIHLTQQGLDGFFIPDPYTGKLEIDL